MYVVKSFKASNNENVSCYHLERGESRSIEEREDSCTASLLKYPPPC